MQHDSDRMFGRRGFLKAGIWLGAAAVAARECRPAWASTTKPTVPEAKPALCFNVRDYGATAGGATSDTASLQRTIDRCFALGGGEVVLPAGRYLSGSLHLRSNVTLRLEQGATLAGSANLDDYEIGQVRWEGKWIPGYMALINAVDARTVAVTGEGAVEGNPAVGGRPTSENPLRRPALIEFIGCNGIHLEGFSTSYKHMWSIHPICCDSLVIRNLKVRSTETNADGIDIDSCRHVLIDSCDIASGDDCISLKSGRGEEANLQNRPTEDVQIRNCVLEGRGYSCVGIGTECSAGIRDVVIEHCRIASVFKNAFYIKSRVGRGAFIENITVRNIEAANMRQGFLRINQTGAGTQDANPVPGLAGVTLYRNFHFSDIRVHDAPVLVDAMEIDADKVLDGFTLEKISGTCAKGIALANARNVVVKGITVTGYQSPLLRISNVSGKGLEGAETIPAPKPTAVVEEPATPYRLH